MSDITVRRSKQNFENRSWLLGPHGTEPGTTPSIVLDVALFAKATHYPDGYVPSGIVLGKVTATDKYGPYQSDATDGRETAAVLLFSSLEVRDGATYLIGAGLVHGFVNPDRLPITSGSGALDAAARTELSGIHFEA